jgi:hypothetical protein
VPCSDLKGIFKQSIKTIKAVDKKKRGKKSYPALAPYPELEIKRYNNEKYKGIKKE